MFLVVIIPLAVYKKNLFFEKINKDDVCTCSMKVQKHAASYFGYIKVEGVEGACGNRSLGR
ncbi:hypothetical protein CAI16_09040 [Virgibacillus dokdonensis]|uniref:Uncharacterized protein n=1 Tax=Virgibacillus dokdonensis TaxID=302167 RepID=A0A3E0WSR9_9BACI|nr:hypothetical protein CAI16_09040 [Virgibacillus dokdonensis]